MHFDSYCESEFESLEIPEYWPTQHEMFQKFLNKTPKQRKTKMCAALTTAAKHTKVYMEKNPA